MSFLVNKLNSEPRLCQWFLAIIKNIEEGEELWTRSSCQRFMAGFVIESHRPESISHAHCINIPVGNLQAGPPLNYKVATMWIYLSAILSCRISHNPTTDGFQEVKLSSITTWMKKNPNAGKKEKRPFFRIISIRCSRRYKKISSTFQTSTSNMNFTFNPCPWIYINGNAGIGKLTIARELQYVSVDFSVNNKVIVKPVSLGNSFPALKSCTTILLSTYAPPLSNKVRRNTRLFAQLWFVFLVLERLYVLKCQKQRREVLEAISTSETGRNTTYIFTGSHGYRLAISPMIPRQHMDQAVAHNIPFISVILTCEEEEHMRRATSADRTGNYRHQSKLTDIQVLKGFRNGGELFTFQCEYEMKADITNLSAIEAAQEIYKFVMDCMTVRLYQSGCQLSAHIHC